MASLSSLTSKLPPQITDFLQDLPSDSVIVACSAPVNIAVIKYWGKKDTKLIIPVNSSLSASLDQDAMCSTTCVVASQQFTHDQMFLNGKEESISSNNRLVSVISTLRSRSGEFYDSNGKVKISSAEWSKYRLKIVSFNNFPTAAGLASSASGFACLASTLAELFGFKENFKGELSIMARLGSGSACRSVYGGWVEWSMGASSDGMDSIAVPHFTASHWPSIRILILVANRSQKDTSSTDGMQRTVSTSPLLQHRASHVVPERMKKMVEAIGARDFEKFGELTMSDSNQFHAVCLDTFPPIFYMNDTSKQVIRLVDAFNKHKGRIEAAYTFDAGPNGVIFCEDRNVDTLLSIFRTHFSSPSNESWVHDPLNLIGHSSSNNESVSSVLNEVGQPASHLKVVQCIVTKVGDGPRVLVKQAN